MSRVRLASAIALLSFMAAGLCSCVHEAPGPICTDGSEVRLNISHSLEWTQYEMTLTRAEASDALTRYHLLFFSPGATELPVKELEFTRIDLSRSDFSIPLDLAAGSYDLYAWSDYADPRAETSMYFDTSDFSQIVYSQPYCGRNEYRDAFRGYVRLSVDDGGDCTGGCLQEFDLELERPLARYEFIATDIAEFLEREATRGRMASPHLQASASQPDLSGYKVKMLYPGYMPSRFDNFLNRPTDSATGVSYDSAIELTSANEATIGFDHVMVNGHESSVDVAVEIYAPGGELIARSGTINVPTRRGRNTIVRGRFLTSSASEGVGIDPAFKGEYNIEIR